MRRITSKGMFYRLAAEGVLGNQPQTWATLADWEAAGRPGPIMLRTTRTSGRNYAWLVGKLVVDGYQELLEAGYRVSDILICHMLLREHTIFQGNIADVPGVGLVLEGKFGSYTQREAMLEPQQWYAAAAAAAVAHMFPGAQGLVDAETINLLLEAYPGHVIEFAATSRPYGVLGRYHVIWEVRTDS